MVRWTLDEADASMSKRREVPADGSAARALIDADGQNRGARFFARRNRDDLDPGSSRRLDKLDVVRKGWRQDQTGWPLAFQNRREQAEPILVMRVDSARDEIEPE